MDITPMVPKGRQVIDAYGDGKFKIASIYWDSAVLVTANETRPLPVSTISDLTIAVLDGVFDEGQVFDILLVGCGTRMVPLPGDLQKALRERSISADPMDTGAACRTYNVLMAEGRRVAAVLFPV